jgi:hypothetical protein
MSEQAIQRLNQLLEWLSRYRVEVIVCLVLFFITMASRLISTMAYPIEVGLDGAYYTLNVFTLINCGFFYYDAPVVSFAIAGLFSLLVHDIILGVKIASAFFEAVLVVGVFFAAWSFTEGDWRAGLIAGSLCCVDVSQFQLVTSLVKNQAALAFLPFAIVFFYRFLYKGRRWFDFTGFIIFGCLTTLSHLMTAGILFVALIVVTGYEFIQQLWHREWCFAFQKTALPLIVGGLIFLGVYLGFDLLIPAADTWYTSSSLIKASGYTTSLAWGGVMSLADFFLMGFNPLFPPITWDLWLHIGIALLIGIGIVLLFVRNKPSDRVALVLLFSTVLLGLGLPSWGFRFNGMLFVPMYIILAMGLVAMVNKLVEVISNHFTKLQLVRYGKPSLALILLFIILGGMMWIAIPRFSITSTRITPRAFPQDLSSIDAMQGIFPNDVKLYALHGIEYFITSRTWYEAAPASESENFPVYAAQRMYYHLNNDSRPSYFVISPWSRFLDSLQPIENDLIEVLSFGYFDLFNNSLTIRLRSTTAIHSVQCALTSMADPLASVQVMLTELPGNIWRANVSLSVIPEGMFRLRIVPFRDPQPAPPDFTNIIGDREPLLLYHFENLPRQHVRLAELLVLEATPGWYQVFGVNTTTALAIDLLNLDVQLPDFPGPPRPPDPYMLVSAPLYYLPFFGELSNFIIILVFCPLLALYWLLGGLLIVWLVRRIYPRISSALTYVVHRVHTNG